MTALISLLSLITTTIGGGVIAWLAYKQSQVALGQKKIEADLELARLEAAKRNRRTLKNVKSLNAKQDAQTEILTGTKTTIEKLEKQTNGMQERLLKEAESRAHAEGKAAGVIHGKEMAEEVAAKVAKEVIANTSHSPAPPQQVEVVNQTPVPVEVVHLEEQQ